MKYVILLTACINPGEMAFTKLLNPDERKHQYIDAINYYVSNTTLPIVFAENSNIDISSLFDNTILSGRLEMFTFKGNENKRRGKGYGEAEIIDYALTHSKIIDNTCVLIKITGRLLVINIYILVALHQFCRLKPFVQCSVNSDFNFADSRVIIAPVSFFKEFLTEKNQINDGKGMFFEHVLIDKIKNDCNYSPFLIEPQIIGVSGSTGDVYKRNKHSLNTWMSYMNYQLYIVVKYRRYTFVKRSYIKSLLVYIFYFIIKLICRVCKC